MDINGSCYEHLPFIEFAYTNSYHPKIWAPSKLYMVEVSFSNLLV